MPYISLPSFCERNTLRAFALNERWVEGGRKERGERNLNINITSPWAVWPLVSRVSTSQGVKRDGGTFTLEEFFVEAQMAKPGTVQAIFPLPNTNCWHCVTFSCVAWWNGPWHNIDADGYDLLWSCGQRWHLVPINPIMIWSFEINTNYMYFFDLFYTIAKRGYRFFFFFKKIPLRYRPWQIDFFL